MNAGEGRRRLENVRKTYNEYVCAAERENDYRKRISYSAAHCFSDVPKGEHSGNSREDKMIRLLTYSEETAAAKLRADNARADAEQLISCLDSETERNVLTLRYLGFRKWEDINGILCYDRSWIFRLHNRALGHIADMTDDLHKKSRNRRHSNKSA